MPLTVAIPCLSDNYAWLLRDEATGTVAICDPGEAGRRSSRRWRRKAAAARPDPADPPPRRPCRRRGRGAGALRRQGGRRGGRCAPAAEARHGGEARRNDVARRDASARGDRHAGPYPRPYHLFIPRGRDVLLCGDTLFSLGCGRLLEGTAAEMFDSLRASWRRCRRHTLVCCGHEYTESNARFALTVEPDNAALQAMRRGRRRQLRAAGQPTVPSTLAQRAGGQPVPARPGRDAGLPKSARAKDKFR